MTQYPASPLNLSQRPEPPAKKERGRILGTLAAIGLGIVKFGALLLKIKVLGSVLTMFISVAAYTLLFGWKFAVGFVLLIFVHEVGHVLWLRKEGVKAGLPIFLPFLGAFVAMKEQPKTAYVEAKTALAGPVAGTLAALAVWGAAREQHSAFLLALAFTGFFLNLFNLLPALPLDGGRVAGAISVKLWFVGLLMVLGLEIYRPSFILPLILIVGGLELYQRWRNRNDPASKAYFTLTTRERSLITVGYLGLMALLVLCMQATYVVQRF